MPRSHRGDLDWERRTRTYLWSSLSAVPGSIVYSITYYWAVPDGAWPPAALVAGGITLFLLGPLGLRWTGSFRLMLTLVLGYALFEATALSLLHGGLVSPIPIWLTLIVIAAALTGGRRMALAWWGAVLAVYGGLFAVDWLEVELPTQLPQSFLTWLWFPANLCDGVLALGLFGCFEAARRRAVDELGAVRRELDAARVRADAADRSRAGFLSRMSHELRSPLMAILGFTDLLVEHGSAEEEQHPPGALQAMERSGAHLLQMVDDVLDVSMIESDTLATELRPFSAAEIVEEAIAIARLSADRKQVRLHARCGELPPLLLGDAIRVRQILVNLIANAIKFTGEGEVEVRADWSAVPAPALTFEVRDTGIGMTVEQQQRLFRPYEQAEAATARLYGGTGLGLTISKLLTEALGGSIHMHSVPGTGTTMRVVIPAATCGSQRNSPHAHVPMEEGMKGMRVLIVDDLRDNRVLLSHHLRRAGASVESASSGTQALATMASAAEPPHLVLMDLQMPEMDGYETTAALRRSGFTGRIVALTADALASTRLRCLEVGFDDFATKPISAERLLELVRSSQRRERAHGVDAGAARGAGAMPAHTAVAPDLAPAPPAPVQAGAAGPEPLGLLRRLLRRLDAWIDSFVPHAVRGDPDASRQAQLTARYALAPLLLWPIEMLFPLALKPEFRAVALALILVQVPLLLRVPFQLRATGSSDAATRPILWYVFVTVAFLCLVTGGTRSPAVPWNIAPAVLALVLCSPAIAVRWAAAGVGMQCALFAAQLLDVSLPDALLPGRVAGAHLVSMVAIVSVSLAAALVYEADKGEALATLLSANTSVRQALSTVERASASKARFLATLSHEMRTPMTAILGFADLMAGEERKEPLDELQADALERIQINAHRLLRLINNLLDLSKIEEGLLQTERVPFHLGALLAELREHVCTLHAGRALDLSLAIGETVPEWIEGDPTRVRQILVELLENARQHTEDGRVELRVGHRSETGELWFEIQDSGAGLSEAELALWNGRDPGSTSASDAALTLGRRICLGLARLLGAELRTANGSGGGARFRLSLPVHAGARGALSETWKETELEGPAKALEATRILLVEDSADSRRLIAHVLREAGAELQLAEDGRAALEEVQRAAASNARFDLILMDMQLPVLDGLEATRRLRGMGYTTPILALTAEDLSHARGPCLEAGCNAVESKPIDRHRLTAVAVDMLRDGPGAGRVLGLRR